jgi:nitroreductase
VAAAAEFATQAPALVVVMSAPVQPHKIPLWEQELSAGAACMNLLHAVHAAGFVGGWITGWPAYSPGVRDLFGGEGERIAGFIFIGTPGRPLEERPRGDLDAAIGWWDGTAGL